MGTVSEAPSWGCLLAISGPYTERIFTVGFSGGLIGRSRKCAISLLHDCEVSHNHAVIELINGVLCIRDVGSTFGTYLNDKRLSEPKRASDAYKLKPCDSIKVGQTSLRWRPIGDIRRALMVCVPQPCGFPHDVLLRLPPATLSSDDQGHLLSTLTALYVQHMEVPPHSAPPQTHTAPACEGPAAPRNGASRPLHVPLAGLRHPLPHRHAGRPAAARAAAAAARPRAATDGAPRHRQPADRERRRHGQPGRGGRRCERQPGADLLAERGSAG